VAQDVQEAKETISWQHHEDVAKVLQLAKDEYLETNDDILFRLTRRINHIWPTP